jgi:hypothetical protein
VCAWCAGPELETADVDYLCTTPPALLNTIENVLQLYDSSTRRATMAGEAASLMNPEVGGWWWWGGVGGGRRPGGVSAFGMCMCRFDLSTG